MFRLLGFDVHVRIGFVVFLALIATLYGTEFGLWLAGSLAVLTLLHELGHAVAARSAGADASISLDFLAGYTSFSARTPISRPRRALISIAGPLTQIVISVAVLVAMGYNPFSIDELRGSDAAAAIWWAGPVIGLMNLIPVLPLDGGHLALTGLDKWLGHRAQRVMAIASIVLTVGSTVVLYLTGGPRLTIFVVFLLVSQIQILLATSPKRETRNLLHSGADAEASAWQTGRPGILEAGQELSPWYRAHRALAKGDDAGAARAIVDDLVATSPRRWRPPTAAAPAQLRAIVDVLPDHLPAGNEYSARVLNEVLLTAGQVERAGEYAVARFHAHRSSTAATMVARCSARMGQDDNAVAWLLAARDALADEPIQYRRLLATTIDHAPEFHSLGTQPDVTQLRVSLD